MTIKLAFSMLSTICCIVAVIANWSEPHKNIQSQETLAPIPSNDVKADIAEDKILDEFLKDEKKDSVENDDNSKKKDPFNNLSIDPEDLVIVTGAIMIDGHTSVVVNLETIVNRGESFYVRHGLKKYIYRFIRLTGNTAYFEFEDNGNVISFVKELS